jgi:hypothetical protein
MTDEFFRDDDLWKIGIEEERFKQLATDKSFAALVALSRAINMLRFVQMPLLAHEGDTSPAAARAGFNSLFFSCAIYAESYLLVQRIRAHFWKASSFQKLEAVSIKNPKAQKNKLVFHLDVDEIGQQLRQMDATNPVFLDAMGESNAQVHYVLGDRCAWQTLHERSLLGATASESPTLEELSNDISDRIIEFTDAAEEFIADALARSGWRPSLSTR